MKISKKRAIELAAWEQETRAGSTSPILDEDDDDWTWEDQVRQDGDYKAWINDAPGMVATMAYDGYFAAGDLKSLKKRLGLKLYTEALEAYFTGDHDT